MNQQNDFDQILLAQAQTTSQTLFTTQVPGFEWSDGVSYEMGMKFQSATSGQITAIRYWKAVNETGTHTGRIWSATGSILASITFSNETPSGWQQQALSTPLTIQANTTYVVTVSCNSYYGVTNNGLVASIVHGDLRSVADGNNAVFGSLNSFPNSSYQNSNYFRDIVFVADSSSPQITQQTVFTTQVPGFEWSDGVSYELGMKFQSATSGQITAIRYWKAVNETGTHTGRIWSATGSILASITFSNETPSGWQQQALSTPLTIQANTTYVVTVSCNSYFGVTTSGLATSIVNGDLRSVADGNNAVFGSLNSFPSSSYQNSNYFRDIVFVTGSSLTKVSGDNQTATAGSALPSPLVIKVTNSTGNLQAGVTVSFAVASGGGSVSPTSAVTGSNGQASTVLTLGATAGITNTVIATASGIGSISFSASANPANTNAIYLENQKPGTTNWQIPQVGQSDIAGYAVADSVNKGSSLPIKVSLAQSGNYTIDVYRLGFYAGTGGRLIFSSGNLSGIIQPPANFDSSTLTISCENWSISYTLQVGNDWTTGLYIAKLTDQRSGSQSQVLFVVRDDNGGSDILCQVSFNTLQAYNLSGGYSLYGQGIGGQKALKVSYDRPYAQHSTLTGANPYNNIILAWEYNMLRWLESQAYDVSYITNLDVHAKPQILQGHKVFLSVGHDEYWSLEEFNSVQSSSINKGFFSGNSVYWRVRFENSSTGVTNRIMACYKDVSDPVAPTYKFRSPENNKPESALKGNMYIGGRWQNFYFNGSDLVVKNSTDPYYANTNLHDGDKLTGLMGFEWDAINLNASPNGLVSLGESTQLQALDQAELEGFPAGTDPRISQVVRFTSTSGAKVFSSGSVQFMWALDSYGVTGPREDTRVKQMVVNILADMGARPVLPGANIIVP